MKKRIWMIFSGMLAVLLIFSLVGCESKDEKEIKNLLLEFEYSCNSMDVNSLMNCFEPAITDEIRLGAGLLGINDVGKLFDAFVGYLLYDADIPFLSDIGVSGVDFMSSIDLSIEEIEIEEDVAIAYTIVSAEIAGQKFTRKAEFLVVYYIDRWCISEFYII